jgi:hypothetical protein
MGVTSIFGFPYPEDSTPNDLHQFFMDLANAVETEMVRQGTLAARPAAGKRAHHKRGCSQVRRVDAGIGVEVFRG